MGGIGEISIFVFAPFCVEFFYSNFCEVIALFVEVFCATSAI
jgi:hypothetical protein